MLGPRGISKVIFSLGHSLQCCIVLIVFHKHLDCVLLSTHCTKNGNPVINGMDRTIIWIKLYLRWFSTNHRHYQKAYHAGANSESSRKLPGFSQQILPMISPENAEKAWSKRITAPDPSISINRLSNFRTTSASSGCRRVIPIREKNGSRGFRLRLCRSWSVVSKCDPYRGYVRFQLCI